MRIKNYYVAEYSVSQNCFHIEQLDEMLFENMRISVQKSEADFIPIGFFDTHMDAHEFIEKVRPTIQGEEYAAKFKEVTTI